MSYVDQGLIQTMQDTQDSKDRLIKSSIKTTKLLTATITDDSKASFGKYYVEDEQGSSYWAYAGDTSFINGTTVMLEFSQENDNKYIIGEKLKDEDEDGSSKAISLDISNFLSATGNIIKPLEEIGTESYIFDRSSQTNTFPVRWLRDKKVYLLYTSVEVSVTPDIKNYTPGYYNNNQILEKEQNGYGVKITLKYFDDSEKYIYFSAKDFLGCLFDTRVFEPIEEYYKQEILFTLKDYDIDQVQFIYWNWYENVEGFTIKYKNPVIKLGIDRSDYTDDGLIDIYCEDQNGDIFVDNYFYPTGGEGHEVQNAVTFYLDWLMYDEDQDQLISLNRLPNTGYEIRWYEYKPGFLKTSTDEYSETNWPRKYVGLNEYFEQYKDFVRTLVSRLSTNIIFEQYITAMENTDTTFSQYERKIDTLVTKTNGNRTLDDSRSDFKMLCVLIALYVMDESNQAFFTLEQAIALQQCYEYVTTYIENYKGLFPRGKTITAAQLETTLSTLTLEATNLNAEMLIGLESMFQNIPYFSWGRDLPQTLGKTGTKAVILKNGLPLLDLIYTNDIILVNGETAGLDQRDYGNSLTLVPRDNTNGSYNMYNLSNSLRDMSQAEIVRAIDVYYDGKLLNLDDVESISWSCPTDSKRSMIEACPGILYDGLFEQKLAQSVSNIFYYYGYKDSNFDENEIDYYPFDMATIQLGETVDSVITFDKLFKSLKINPEEQDSQTLAIAEEVYVVTKIENNQPVFEKLQYIKRPNTFTTSQGVDDSTGYDLIETYLDHDNIEIIKVIKNSDSTVAGDKNKDYYFNIYGTYSLKYNDNNKQNILLYKIKPQLNRNAIDNYISARVQFKNGTFCTGGIMLRFNNAGTNGSPYNFYLAEASNKAAVLTVAPGARLSIVPHLEDYATSMDLTNTATSIDWELLQKNDLIKDLDITNSISGINLEIIDDLSDQDMVRTLMKTNKMILKASINYNDYNLETFLPIALRADDSYVYLLGTTDLYYDSNSNLLFNDEVFSPYSLYCQAQEPNGSMGEKEITCIVELDSTENFELMPCFSDTAWLQQIQGELKIAGITNNPDCKIIVGYKDQQLLGILCQYQNDVDDATGKNIKKIYLCDPIDLDNNIFSFNYKYNGENPRYYCFIKYQTNEDFTTSIGGEGEDKDYINFSDIMLLKKFLKKSEYNNNIMEFSDHIELDEDTFDGLIVTELMLPYPKNFNKIYTGNSLIEYYKYIFGETNGIFYFYKNENDQYDSTKYKIIFNSYTNINDPSTKITEDSKKIEFHIPAYVNRLNEESISLNSYFRKIVNRGSKNKRIHSAEDFFNLMEKYSSLDFSGSTTSYFVCKHNLIFKKNTIGGEKVLWTQPIVQIRNAYPSSIVNEWDGKAKINEEQGTILAPMLVAGTKGSGNRFTGVILGTPQGEKDPTMTYTGIYGYQDGIQSYGFRSNGTAFLGMKNTGGCIDFDGVHGIIQSGNYSVSYDSTKGRLVQGTKIDLQNGFIDSINMRLTDKKLSIGNVKSGTIDMLPNQGLIKSGNDSTGLKINLQNGILDFLSKEEVVFKRILKPDPAFARIIQGIGEKLSRAILDQGLANKEFQFIGDCVYIQKNGKYVKMNTEYNNNFETLNRSNIQAVYDKIVGAIYALYNEERQIDLTDINQYTKRLLGVLYQICLEIQDSIGSPYIYVLEALTSSGENCINLNAEDFAEASMAILADTEESVLNTNLKNILNLDNTSPGTPTETPTVSKTDFIPPEDESSDYILINIQSDRPSQLTGFIGTEEELKASEQHGDSNWITFLQLIQDYKTARDKVLNTYPLETYPNGVPSDNPDLTELYTQFFIDLSNANTFADDIISEKSLRENDEWKTETNGLKYISDDILALYSIDDGSAPATSQEWIIAEKFKPLNQMGHMEGNYYKVKISLGEHLYLKTEASSPSIEIITDDSSANYVREVDAVNVYYQFNIDKNAAVFMNKNFSPAEPTNPTETGNSIDYSIYINNIIIQMTSIFFLALSYGYILFNSLIIDTIQGTSRDQGYLAQLNIWLGEELTDSIREIQEASNIVETYILNKSDGDIILKSAVKIDCTLPIEDNYLKNNNTSVTGRQYQLIMNAKGFVSQVVSTSYENDETVLYDTDLLEIMKLGVVDNAHIYQLNIDTDLSVQNELTVQGATSLKSTLNVTGESVLNNVIVNSTATINGFTQINNGINITGATTIYGPTNIHNAAHVLNNFTIDGTCTIKGACTMNDICTINDIFVINTTNFKVCGTEEPTNAIAVRNGQLYFQLGDSLT